jgi:hypothetical protein
MRIIFGPNKIRNFGVSLMAEITHILHTQLVVHWHHIQLYFQ